MHFTRFPARALPLASALVILVAACTDAPAPLSPDAGPSARLVPAACDGSEIRRSINVLYPGNRHRTAAHAAFEAARADAAAGRTSEAIAGFLGLGGDLVTRYMGGLLRDPPGAPTVRDGTGALLDALFGCAGLAPVSSQLPAVQVPPGGAGLFDAVAEVVMPGEPFDVRTPSDRFAFTDAAGAFMDEPALVLLYRIPDAIPFAPSLFAEYPPRYRVDVIPYTAQANFDDDGDLDDGPEDVVPGEGPTALVSICPNEPHPEPHTALRVLRNPERFLMEPPHLLPAAAPAPLTCEGNTQAPVFALGAPPAPPSALARLVAGLGGGLRAAGSRVAALLGPAPLYAVDGGAGGRTRAASDFVAALPRTTANALDSVMVRDRLEIPITILQLAGGFVETLTAVPLNTTAGPAPVPIPTAGIACTWSVSEPDLFRLSATEGLVIQIERLAAGASQLAVTCTDGTRGATATLPMPDMFD